MNVLFKIALLFFLFFCLFVFFFFVLFLKFSNSYFLTLVQRVKSAFMPNLKNNALILSCLYIFEIYIVFLLLSVFCKV